MDRTESKKTVIECDCGTHMLQVQSEVDYFDSGDVVRFHQDIYLAMFRYGNQRRNFFSRCIIACKYLLSGEMHSDQLVLSPSEARKLSEFINENLVESVSEKPTPPPTQIIGEGENPKKTK